MQLGKENKHNVKTKYNTERGRSDLTLDFQRLAINMDYSGTFVIESLVSE